MPRMISLVLGLRIYGSSNAVPDFYIGGGQDQAKTLGIAIMKMALESRSS